ncbi:1-acyl-sn-glycerol-3-phosphate acyltransferase [Capnocytophaga canimorsus]|uniref:1-acyl-sn-glycerol-3-phosphate acyltransferase n=1 Tax=Capnocytophaga canimorsus TaxID=28188 RepID=UPI0005A93D9E|nr:1-acyl-sn-glycerol-3-phosphate acyltransferase [Capnocytophaga canimorsus]ATA76644.1 glycerol acyltransferase [Capnocytophaga canimorsus]
MLDHFESIRPYHDSEIHNILEDIYEHSLMQAMMLYAFPELSQEQRNEKLLSNHSIFDFQRQIMYQVVKKAIAKSMDDFTFEGFEKLKPDTAYLFISNHRDIILDTSLLNVTLHDHNLKMTASAVGDNLIRKKVLKALSLLNRNFIIHRNLPPREALEKSKIVSKYIKYCITAQNRSVWIAQREGRTKDGDDRTQQGVLKMLSLAKPENQSVMQYFKQLNIVPMAISYEFDPTDMMKIPALMAQHYGVEYVKSKKEDFENIFQGLVGQKGRVHISVGTPLNDIFDKIEIENTHVNKQLQQLADYLDQKIHQQYKLFPTNYIAYDMLYQTNAHQQYYSEKEIRQFERRMNNRSKSESDISKRKFLEMYSNPVKNKLFG